MGDLLLLWMLAAGGSWAWFCWQWQRGRFWGGSGDTNLFPHVNEAQIIFGGTLSTLPIKCVLTQFQNDLKIYFRGAQLVRLSIVVLVIVHRNISLPS